MKKLLLALTTALLTFGVSAFAADDENNSEKVSFTIQKTNGPNKEGVMAFTKTYQYPADEIEDAILEKLKEEGITGKKASNNYYAFKGVKYNSLWNRTCDIYIAVNGSQKAGTMYLLISTGYDNYISDNDPEENKKISDWMDSLEDNIKNHLYNHQLENQEKETEEAIKDLNDIKKDKEKIEKKIADNEKDIKTLEATRTVVDETNANTVDPKVLKKEQKLYDKLMDKRNKLQYDLDNIKAKLESARDKFNSKKDELKKLKENRP